MSGILGPALLRTAPGAGVFQRPIPVPLGGRVPVVPTLPPTVSPVGRLPVGGVGLPTRVLPSVPLTSPIGGGIPAPVVSGVPARGLTTGLSPIRPGTITGAVTGGVPAAGTTLGATNGYTPVRPGLLVPGGLTPTQPGGVLPGATLPGRISPTVVAPTVVAPGLQPGIQQSQGTFLDRVLGGNGLQVSPNGMAVGPQGYPQQYYGQQPGYPMRGQPGVAGAMPPGYGYSTPNGSCLPQSNGLVGIFDSTIGAGLKKLFGVRDTCWGPGVGMPGQQGLMPGQQVVPGGARYPVGVGTPGVGIAPGGVQLTRPMPSVANPRAFQ